MRARVAAAAAALLGLAMTGCVQQAVLENDVRSATWKARTLSTASDLSLAHAALSAQLVELEALYQRNPDDPRVTGLLSHGYELMASGFVELRRLEAVAAGDDARAEQEARLRADAEARASYYRRAGARAPSKLELEQQLSGPRAACERRDREAYERALQPLLALGEEQPEQRLERALVRRHASLWLSPRVAARCHF